MKTAAQKLLAVVSKTAVSTWKEYGELRPVFHIEDKFGIHIPIFWVEGFNGIESKEECAKMVRQAIKTADAVRYAFVSECWIVDGTKQDDKGELAMRMSNQGISLQGHPDRIEAVAIWVEDKNGERYTRTYQILRPEHGPATLAPPQDRELTGIDQAEGRFMGLFEEEAE